MTTQFSLAGFDDPPPRNDQLFFAIRPDAAAAERIEALVRTLSSAHGLKGRSLGERFHVTLLDLGKFAGVPTSIVDEASEAVDGLAAATAPFRLGFDRVASFSPRARNKPLVLLGTEGVLALTAFQEALEAAAIRLGSPQPAKSRFTPHLTLLYDDRTVAEQPVEPIAWTAQEFVLVHSLVGQSRHEVLARFGLRGAAGAFAPQPQQ